MKKKPKSAVKYTKCYECLANFPVGFPHECPPFLRQIVLQRIKDANPRLKGPINPDSTA